MTNADDDGYAGEIILEWRGTPPSADLIDIVVNDIRASLWGLSSPDRLASHIVFLATDPADWEHGPAVHVWGEKDNPRFVCEFTEKLEPTPLKAIVPKEGTDMSHNHKRALLIVDVQNGFCPGGNLPVEGGDEIVPVINAMTASGYYDLVIASQDWHPAGHGSFASSHPGKNVFELGELGGQPQVMWPDHCVQGTRDAEFHPDLDMTKVSFIQQKGTDPEVDSYSAFRDNAADKPTGLAEWLCSQDIQTLDVCGLATDYCVKATAVDATKMLSPQTRVRFVEDASRGISPAGVASAVAEMQGLGIDIVRSSIAHPVTGDQ